MLKQGILRLDTEIKLSIPWLKPVSAQGQSATLMIRDWRRAGSGRWPDCSV